MPSIQVEPVKSRRALREFVRFPWKVYRGDRNWVPPVISERMQYLDPRTGPYHSHADIELLVARRGREVVGTVAAFVDHTPNAQTQQAGAGFGFFETIEEYEAARHLLDAACAWARARGMRQMRGPTSFSDNDCPGVLVEGTSCPPVMLEAHTPLYYQEFLHRYGMEKADDLFAWRVSREQIGRELQNLPAQLVRVADVAHRSTMASIRSLRMEQWDAEIGLAYSLFATTLHNLFQRTPYPEAEFRQMAGRLRPLLDPDLALIAEVGGRPVGLLVAIPDINQVLIHINGRMWPFGWWKARQAMGKIDTVSFKLMGVLEEFRRRGIDALLYLEAVKRFYEKGYTWLDGSVTSETNTVINLIAARFGAERYKHFRIFQITL